MHPVDVMDSSPLLFLFILAGVSSAQVAPAEKFNWQPIEIGEHEYVSIDQVKSFYEFDQLQIRDDVNHGDGKILTLKNKPDTTSFRTKRYDAYFNGVKFWIAHPIVKKDDSYYVSQFDLSALIDPILRPKFIKNAGKFDTVVLDAGHGGKDLGSAKQEAKHTLQLANKLKSRLEDEGYKVIMTRDKDIFVSLADRVRMANDQKNAIFVSLHFNSGNRHARGFETYVLSHHAPGKKNYSSSIALATEVHSQVFSSLGKGQMRDRGIRSAKFNVLNACKHPSILIEAGFLTNKEEAAMVTAEDYQRIVAEGIMRGVRAYKAAVSR